jgi:thymidine kinase
MIKQKYTGINYNGITKKKKKELTNDETKNMFDHSVVIIDEAHNMVSRIVNKIPKIKGETAQQVHRNHTLRATTDGG